MKKEMREKARQLRIQGMAVRQIADTLGVSRSSISLWVRDIELTEAQQEVLKKQQPRWGAQNKGSKTNREKFLKVRIVYQEEGREKAKEGRSLHIIGCMLYWAEGAKRRNDLYFVNSDTNMMLLFIRFLREEPFVSDEKMTITITCHHQEDIERVNAYWTGVLGLPQSCLRKTQVKKPGEVRRNILQNGVCGLRVNGASRYVQHIYGAIQEYGGFENPAWLF